MKASILALSTAVPPYTFTQEDIVKRMIDILEIEDSKAEGLRQLYQNSAIRTRHFVMPDFAKDRQGWEFWGADYPRKAPSTAQRNALYKIEAPKLAYSAAYQALKKWGRNPKDISHVISISCTGMVAPGIEFELLKQLDLRWSIQRLAINFMGCFGAFKGLAVADALAKEDPQHRVLVVCTELCSLHLQAEQTPDNILANSLFSDGAAAVVVGAKPKPEETSLWTICNKGALGLDNSLDKMSWEVGDHGFVMKLSHRVPALLGQQISGFVSSLVDSNFSSSECDWAIHPGGKSIIQAIEKTLKLEPGLAQASWDTLEKYGNMSSATFLFVLNRLLEQQSTRRWTLGIGFGPGLSMEGILLARE